MRASGASELRKFWNYNILKLLFLSIFCRYIRFFVGTNDMLVGLYMYRQNCEKAILGGGGSCSPAPSPPSGYADAACNRPTSERGALISHALSEHQWRKSVPRSGGEGGGGWSQSGAEIFRAKTHIHNTIYTPHIRARARTYAHTEYIFVCVRASGASFGVLIVLQLKRPIYLQ